MKTLKFRPDLIPLILSGEKTSTWRFFDEKNLQKGDDITFLNSETKEPFAKVFIAKTLEKPLEKLTNEEKGGHEEYANDEEMLKILQGYYSQEITLKTPVKIIKFRLIEKI